MLTLLSLHPFNSQDILKLREGLQEMYTLIFPDDFSEENLLFWAQSADVLLGMKVSEKVLANSPNLKLIQTPGAGVEKLPLSLLKQRGIILCNSHSNSYYVAEYAIALVLALAKKIVLPNEDPFVSGSLRGKVVAVLGYGNIGQKVCDFLKSFDCTVTVFRRQKGDEGSAIHFIPDLKEVLSRADYIIVTLPLTSTTKGLLGEKEFAIMKKSACIINVGRGPVIDQEALYTALKEGSIRAAAIDVWYDDFVKSSNVVQYSTKFPFEKLNNIILSPYRAAIMEGAPHLDDVIRNLRLFATTSKVINQVDLEQGY